MRKVLIAAAACAVAAPLAAQPVPAPYPDPRDEGIVENLPTQPEIEAMGDAVGRTVDAVLDVPIGPIVEAANPGRPMSRREREETLGERASRDDPYYRERLRHQIGAASAGMGVLVEQMAALTPVLRAALEDVQRRVEDAARGLPPRDYGRDYDPGRYEPGEEEYRPVDPLD